MKKDGEAKTTEANRIKEEALLESKKAKADLARAYEIENRKAKKIKETAKAKAAIANKRKKM